MSARTVRRRRRKLARSDAPAASVEQDQMTAATLRAEQDVMIAPAAVAPPVPELSRLRRFLRYMGVNIATCVFDYSIFLCFTYFYPEAPTLASVLAYAIALDLNYDLSRRFVFGTDGSHKSEERLSLEFLLTGLVGLAITAAVTPLGVYVMNWTPVRSKTVAVLVCFVVLYFVRSRLVFSKQR